MLFTPGLRPEAIVCRRLRRLANWWLDRERLENSLGRVMAGCNGVGVVRLGHAPSLTMTDIFYAAALEISPGGSDASNTAQLRLGRLPSLTMTANLPDLCGLPNSFVAAGDAVGEGGN